MSSEPAIRVENVSKSYNIYATPRDRLKQMVVGRLRRAAGLSPVAYYSRFEALRDVSFEIGRGETVGIVGRNGSGKSTLLQIICGTLSASEGKVVRSGRIAALLELGAGFNPEFTGRDNATLNAAILGLSPEEVRVVMPKIEEFADVGEFFDRPMTTYSSGMYVRVAFAVQALIEPDILIVDEALAVGDAQFQAKCHDRIRKLREGGTTILLVSHDIAAIRMLCDRTVWIDSSRIRMDGPVDSVTSEYTRQLFEGANRSSVDADAASGNGARLDDGDSISEMPVVNEIDEPPQPPPLNHWGSRKGLIKSVHMTNSQGQRTRVCRDREEMTIAVEIDVPEDLPRETLSVAISVKSLTGLDLFVGSTWHDGRLSFNDKAGRVTVRFAFQNMLNSGDYMLAVAIEDNTNIMPEYYEHIEGALYLRVDMKGKHFGMFAPSILKTIESQS